MESHRTRPPLRKYPKPVRFSFFGFHGKLPSSKQDEWNGQRGHLLALWRGHSLPLEGACARTSEALKDLSYWLLGKECPCEVQKVQQSKPGEYQLKAVYLVRWETEHASPTLKETNGRIFLVRWQKLEFCGTLHSKSAVSQCLSVSLVHTILTYALLFTPSSPPGSPPNSK
jgi:hypothetical protein